MSSCACVPVQRDPVAPLRVAEYVWNNSLAIRPNAPARYVRSADGGHFLCHDTPELYACLVRDPRGNCTQGSSFEAGSTYP